MPQFQSDSDEKLIRLLKQGSHEAFEVIYNRYWLVVYRRFFKKLQSKVLAEEYTQELFASLWSRRNDLIINISLVSYLNGAVRKMVINNIRAEIRKKLMLEESQLLPNPSTEEDDQLLKSLNLALNDLPDKTGQIIKMSKLEGFSVKEIAAQQNLSNKAVEYHITKALKLLKGYFKNLKNTTAPLFL